MKGGLRLLFVIGIALAVFALIIVMLVAGVGLAIYEKVDIWNNPVVTWIANANGTTSASEERPPEQANSLPSLTDFGNYKTENNWIAANIAREIAVSSWLAISPHAPLPKIEVKADVDPLKGQIHLEFSGWADKPVTTDLTAAYAWDPKAYAQLAQQLLAAQKAVEPANADLPNVAEDLLTPKGDALGSMDVTLSSKLQANPACVSLHEDAALLLLTLVIRENAYNLSDGRIEMNRACAHLAIARALRGGDPTSQTGKIAEAALVTLSGRETEALPLVAALGVQPGASEEQKTWSQILTLENKCDWRTVTPDQSSPLLLKIAWFQTVVQDLGETLGFKYLASLGTPEQVPDWGRTLLGCSNSPPVEVGHAFCSSTIGLEFRELGEILKAEGQPLQQTTKLGEVFKNPVGASVTADSDGQNKLHIVGVDLFEDISQRHLVSAIWATHFWLRNNWGVPDQDAQFSQQMKKLFQGTRDEQILLTFLNAADNQNHSSQERVTADLSDIPPEFAIELQWDEPDCDRLIPYFSWGVPFGAPFEMNVRRLLPLNARLSHHHPDPHAPGYRDLLQLAPDSYTLASWPIILNQDSHVTNTVKDERSLLEPFFDYNIYALGFFHSLADQQNSLDDATLEQLLRKKTALDPDDYYGLGDFLMSHGRADEAADAYRKGAQQGNDQVLFSDCIQPLVKYDFEHNQQDEAMTMAKRAADVYSAEGLETYAWLLCKLNRGPEALEVIKQVQDRYGGDPFPEFYAANADTFPTQFADAVKALYPDGMPTVTLSDFTTAPKDGCSFKTDSDFLTRAGLHVGDVVVALDSHPVHNAKTYTFARAMSDAPVMDLIVWRQGKYLEVKASPPGRLFGNEITDYTHAQ